MREADLLRFQIEELTAAGLEDVDEAERLETEEEILAGVGAPSGLRWMGGALALLVPLAWGAAIAFK